MAEPAPSEPVAGAADPDEQAESLFADLRNLAQDAQTAVEAEVHYQKALASYALGEVKGIAIWAMLALSALVIALFALAIGALLGLTPSLGPWGATATVVGALLVLAGLAGWRAARASRRLKRNAFPAAKP